MPDIPALLRALSEATGWAAFGALAVAGLFGFMTGKLVGGRAHDRALAREDAAHKRVEALTEALRDLTEEVRWDTRDRMAARRVADRERE